jgi:hypothetical protein
MPCSEEFIGTWRRDLTTQGHGKKRVATAGPKTSQRWPFALQQLNALGVQFQATQD